MAKKKKPSRFELAMLSRQCKHGVFAEDQCRKCWEESQERMKK